MKILLTIIIGVCVLMMTSCKPQDGTSGATGEMEESAEAKAMLQGIWIESETQEVSTIEPPTEPKYIKDTNATYVTYSDQQKSVSKAKEGHIIQSYRLEYTGNVLTNRVELYRDVYEAQPERIYVGVKSR